MTTIGHLTTYNNGNYEELHGKITTLSFQLSFKLIPDNMRTNPEAPDYIAYADSVDGESVTIGAAWKMVKQQPDNTPFEFLTLSIDDLSLPQAVNAAAFKNDSGGYDISWRRRQTQKG